MTQVRESYRAQLMAANSTYLVRGARIGGFIPKTGGAVSVASTNTLGVAQTLVDEVPVQAGMYIPLPIVSPEGQTITVTLSGGASGTLLI